MIRLLAFTVIVLCFSPAWAEELSPPPAPVVTWETLRLQAAEAAVLAGTSRPPPPVIRKATPTGDRVLVLHRENTPRAFPLPPRMQATPSGAGMQAAITASHTAPLSAPTH